MSNEQKNSKNAQGVIVQCIGAVVDIQFPRDAADTCPSCPPPGNYTHA